MRKRRPFRAVIGLEKSLRLALTGGGDLRHGLGDASGILVGTELCEGPRAGQLEVGAHAVCEMSQPVQKLG